MAVNGRLFNNEQIRAVTKSAFGKYFADWLPGPADERTARERVEEARLHIGKASSIITQMQGELAQQSAQLDELLVQVEEKKKLAEQYGHLAVTNRTRASRSASPPQELQEPPFGWTESNQAAMGADVELAEVVVRAIGATQIEHHLTTFSELLPGVQAGRWDMNVPLFVTPERANQVAFSLPVWAIAMRTRALTWEIAYSRVASAARCSRPSRTTPAKMASNVSRWAHSHKSNGHLLNAVNEQLRSYLGSADHRTRMSKFGLTHNEIDPALVVEPFKKSRG